VRILGSGRCALSICAAAASLAGCGGTQPPIGASGATAQRAAQQSQSAQRDKGSWMAPDAASRDLLYVSNHSWVSVYTYPQGNLVGKLKGFDQASGQCVDSKGDVYITDFGASRVHEYAHGSRKRMRTINVSGAHDCSIDPTSGDLAVIKGPLNGGVIIFKNSRRHGKEYRDLDFYVNVACAYDAKGNLFMEGWSWLPSIGNFVLAELPKGGSQLRSIALNQYMGWPSGIKWHYKYLAISDTVTPAIYQFVIKGSEATRVGTTHLGSNAASVRQFWIQGPAVITSTHCTKTCEAGERRSAVMSFKYPAGGTAMKTITTGLEEVPSGLSVSLAPNR
jgi:hypothetical protein